MQDKPVKLDAARAWTDAMALLRGGREVQLTLAGFFFLLPVLLLLFLRWPLAAASSAVPTMQQYEGWSEANSIWLLLVQLFAAFGRAAILFLLLDRRRPTVGEAVAEAARPFGWFYLTTIIVGLIQSGGFFLFVVPGLYLMGRLFVVEAVFIAEGIRNPFRAIARSFDVTRGNGWRILAVVAIIAVGAAVFMLATGSVIGVLAALIGGPGLDRFVAAVTVATVFAGVWLVLVLLSIAVYRQLVEARHVGSSADG